jgi:hypothetical protein
MTEANIRPYLIELRHCTRIMIEHATCLERAADEWHRIEASASSSGRVLDHHGGPQLPRTLQEAVSTLARDESSVWLALDGFLAATARVSRLLWPDAGNGTEAERRQRSERGRALVALIGAGDNHPLRCREMIDRWLRFDETLDAAIARQGPISPHRFHAGDLGDRETAAEEIDMLDLTVVLDGADRRRFHLRPLFEGARDLDERAAAALRAIETREGPGS